MFKKIKLLMYFLFIIIFIGYTYYIYISEDIVSKINNNRYNYSEIVNDNSQNLKILRNDTQNIIIYNIEKTDEQKIKKRQFWNLLKDEEKSSNN